MRRFIFACAIGVVSAFGISVFGQSATQTPSPTPTMNSISPADVANGISAQWKLNRDLSSLPDPNAALPSTSGASNGSGGRSGSSGGYGGRGGGGGRGGYGGGGYGGGRGGYGSSGTTQTSTPVTMVQARAVMHEFSAPPEILNVVASTDKVSFTSGDGVVKKFDATGKKEPIEFESVKVDVTTKWNGPELEQDMTLGLLKVTRTVQTTDEGRRLIITVTTSQSSDRSSSAQGGTTPVHTQPIKAIYDRVG